jgi:hypothetical protein
MVISSVSYFGEPDGSTPALGVPYGARIVVGADNAINGMVPDVRTGLYLPPGTRFTPGAPVRCFIGDGMGGFSEVSTDFQYQCVQQPVRLSSGVWDLGIRNLPMFRLFIQGFMLTSSIDLTGQQLVGSVTSYLGEAMPAVTVRTPPAPPPARGRIAFVRNPGPFAELQTMAYDGTGRTTVLSEALSGEPAWSPDGQRIAFVSYRDGRAQLYVMDATGANQRRVTTTAPLRDITCGMPRWSPDGSRLLVTAITPGSAWQIYTVNVDGSNQRQLTSSPVDKPFAVGHQERARSATSATETFTAWTTAVRTYSGSPPTGQPCVADS